jgi:hypothetical protein
MPDLDDHDPDPGDHDGPVHAARGGGVVVHLVPELWRVVSTTHAAAAGDWSDTPTQEDPHAWPGIAIVGHDEQTVSIGCRRVRVAVTRFSGVNLGI